MTSQQIKRGQRRLVQRITRMRQNIWSRLTITSALSLALTGCLLGPDYQRPELALPSQYNAADASATRVSVDAQAVRSPINPNWWMLFGDATLDQLVQQTIQDNADVQIALARIGMAQALAAQAGAALYPT